MNHADTNKRIKERIGFKKWNVRVHRGGESIHLGQVFEANESDARCAALSKYGISEDEAEEGTLRNGIFPADDFDVSEAL